MQNAERRCRGRFACKWLILVFILHSAFKLLHSIHMPTAIRDIVVSNEHGLHARPAMQFVDLANQFSSQISVAKGGEEPGEADGKSILQMISLAATKGTPFRITAEGEDAEMAVTKLVQLFVDKFGEPE